MKILLIETLYLGDLVHSLPLLRALRERHPEATLHVLVRAANAPLLEGFPGLDRVLVMDPARHRSPAGLWALAASLRRERYDLVLNPGASDRASWLTALSGGRRRIGRLDRKRRPWLWRRLHDEVLDYPYFAEPMWWQKFSAFREVLELGDCPGFGLDTLAAAATPPGLPERFIHLSPCASEDIRSLPPAFVVALVRQLRRRLPDYPIVLSGGPSLRERQRLALIAAALPEPEVQVHAGSLSLPGLLATVKQAALHIGPDSGPLHLAHALGTPAVGCFLYKDGSAEWQPVGERYRTVGTTVRQRGGLYGLAPEQVLTQALDLLA